MIRQLIKGPKQAQIKIKGDPLMKSRMESPVMIVPDISEALQALGKALFASAEKTSIPSRTLFLSSFGQARSMGTAYVSGFIHAMP